MTPRIHPVSEPDEEQTARLAKTPIDKDGDPLNVFATLAHRPRLMTRVNSLGSCLMFDSPILWRERELVILRTAATIACDYELTHHRSLGSAAGLTDAEIESAVRGDHDHPWSTADRVLLDAADELLDRADLDDATWAALDGILDEEQRIELIVLVGFYRMLGGALNSLRVEVDDRLMTPDGTPR
jgi:AhpD family alkylhydroperoxidase